MTSRERISTAQVSQNLGEVRLEEVGDIDIVRACGMAGVKYPLGVALWRLKYSNDRREVRGVVAGLMDRLAKRWPTLATPELTAVGVLKHFLDDVCHPCRGLGYRQLPGVPVLGDEACEFCGGTGRLSMPLTDEPAVWLREEVARLEHQAAGAIMARLARELEL
jgi:hypothetical protein